MGIQTVELKDSAGVEVLGKVEDNPTANTILARLKDIADNTAVLAP